MQNLIDESPKKGTNRPLKKEKKWNNKVQIENLKKNWSFYLLLIISLFLVEVSIEVLNDEVINRFTSSNEFFGSYTIYELAFGGSLLTSNIYFIFLVLLTFLGAFTLIAFVFWAFLSKKDRPFKYFLLVISIFSYAVCIVLALFSQYIFLNVGDSYGATSGDIYFLWPFVIYVVSLLLVEATSIVLIIKSAIKSFSKKSF